MSDRTSGNGIVCTTCSLQSEVPDCQRLLNFWEKALKINRIIFAKHYYGPTKIMQKTESYVEVKSRGCFYTKTRRSFLFARIYVCVQR